MRDVFPDIDKWYTNGEPVALATVVQTWGSSPRGIGAKMGISVDDRITGSVSGGCVEGAVYQAGIEALQARQPRMLHFGVADETAWDVGLSCGGSIQIFVQPLDPPFFESLRTCLREEIPIAAVTIVNGPDFLVGKGLIRSETSTAFSNLDGDLEKEAIQLAQSALPDERSRLMTLRRESEDELELFVDVILPPPTLIVVGGVHIAIALTAIAKPLGYRTVVIDPRRSFGNVARFPHVDQLIQAWPEEAFSRIRLTRSTAVATLTHDPKVDDPALKIALNSLAFYIGALGSRTTQAKRRIRLLEAGLTESQLARLHAPIGLDIGGETPEEIALSIMGEIVATRKGRVQVD